VVRFDCVQSLGYRSIRRGREGGHVNASTALKCFNSGYPNLFVEQISWLAFAFLAALGTATIDLFCKSVMKCVDEDIAAWARLALTLPFVLPILLFVSIPVPDSTFWLATLGFVSLMLVSIALYARAIKASPLTLTRPMTAFTPAMMLLLSPFILGELPNALGISGVLLVMLGAYVLNASQAKNGILEPLRALGRERGSALMLIVAFIWSITAILGKVAVVHSNPGYFLVISYTATAIIFTGYLLLAKRQKLVEAKPHLPVLFGIGFASAVAELGLMTAFTMTFASFAIAVSRLSILFSAAYGFLVFKEAQPKERLTGILVMLAGVMLMTLA